MSDRDKLEQLFDDLWPCPSPRSDLAERVLARLEQSGDSNRERARPRVVPPLAPPSLPRLVPFTSPPVTSRKGKPRVRVLVGALSLAAAAVFLLAISWTWLDVPEISAQGQQVARERVTISIADRAAAAMEPGADLIWTAHKQRVRVQQRRGSVFYRVDRGDKFRVTTPSGDIEVTGTCFRVSLGAASTLSAMVTMVSVLEGSVTVSSGPDGQTLSVRAGETVRLEAGQPPVPVSESALREQGQQQEQLESDRQLREQAAATEARLRALEELLARSGRWEPAPPPRSALLLPPSTRLRVFGNELGRVSLSLPGAGKGRAAAVEVARDPGFKRPIFSGPARDAYVTVPAPARGDLYWRLTGSAELAGHARFLPDRRRSQPLRRPHNLVSEGAERTTIYFQDAPPAVTLAFAATPGASHYRIRIQREDDPQRPLFDRTVAGPRYPVEPGLLGEGRYQWSAQPLDIEGLPLGQAGPPRLNRLELAYDNALDALAIRLPLPDQRLAGKTVEVAGVAPLGARLFVNGTPAPLDDKGRFALKLGDAPRVLVFRLLGGDGTESYWIRSLRPRS
jgi:hypothetical protein